MADFIFCFSALLRHYKRKKDTPFYFMHLLYLSWLSRLENKRILAGTPLLMQSAQGEGFDKFFLNFIQQQFFGQMKFQFGIVLSILFSLFSSLAKGDLTYFREFNISTNGTIASLDSIRFSQKFISFKAVEKNFQTVTLSLSPPNLKTYLYNLTSSQQIQPDLNNYISGPNNFTSFNLTTITRYINSFTTIAGLYTVGSPNSTIIDCFYEPSNGSLGVLLKNMTAGFYQMSLFQNQVQLNLIILAAQVSWTYFRGEVSEGKCHLLFQQGILIITLDSSLNLVRQINFPAGTNSIVSLGVNSSYLSYSHGTIGYVCTTVGNTYSIIDSVSMNDQIIDLKVAYPYLLISTNANFVQYDLDAKTIISTFTHVLNVTGMKFGLLSNMYAMFYQATIYTQHLYAYKFDNKSSCVGGCTACPNTYSLDPINLCCIKNYSAIVPPQNNTNTTLNATSTTLNATNTTLNSTNATLNTTNTNTNNTNITNLMTNTTLNTTLNTTNTSGNAINANTTINTTNANSTTPNTTNNTTNNTNNNTNNTNISNININNTNLTAEHILNTSLVQADSELVTELLNILGKGLTFSSFRLTPKIFVTFTFFVDDIEFYVYHRQNYSRSVKFFMTKANLINDIKISAWMLEAAEVFNNNSIALEENSKYGKYLTPHPHNPEHTYFLTVSESIYKNYLVVIFLLFCGSKLLYYCIYSIREMAGIFSKMESCLKNKTKFMVFIVALIEPNVSQLSFNCFMQIKLFFSFNIFNSLNLIACVTVLYVIIFYTLALYPLSYALGCKVLASQVLVRSKYGMRSFFSEGFYFCLRAIIKGFVHSFLIENYQMQMAILILVDLLLLLLVLANQKTFQKFSIFLLFVGYNLTFLLLNISFEIGRVIPELVQNLKYDSINFIVIIILVSFALLAILCICLIEANKVRKKILRWLFDEEKIIERPKQRKVLGLQSEIESEVQSPSTVGKQLSKINLSKISIRRLKKKEEPKAPVTKDRWSKSIKQITNKSVIMKKETIGELETMAALQKSMRMDTAYKSRGLIKIKKAKMKKFVEESKQNIRKLIRLESRKWSIGIAE